MVKDYTPTVSILVTPAADMEYHLAVANRIILDYRRLGKAVWNKAKCLSLTVVTLI